MRAIRMALLAALIAGVPAAAQTITYQGDRANTCVSVPPGANSHVLTITGSNITVGQTVIINAATETTLPLGTVVDSAGNTWTTDMFLAPSFRVFTISARVTSPLNVGGTITLPYTNGGGTAISCAVVSVFSGLVTAPSYLDKTGSGSASSSGPIVFTSGSTTQPNELVMGNLVATAATGGFTPGAGMTTTASACSGSFCIFPEFAVVNTSGTQMVSAMFGNPILWGGIVATYKDVVAPVELQRFEAE